MNNNQFNETYNYILEKNKQLLERENCENKTINEKIKCVRRNSIMTQRELSKKTNIQENKLSKIETGKIQPNAEEIKNICLALDISADWLLLNKIIVPNKKIQNEQITKSKINTFTEILQKDEQELLDIYKLLSKNGKIKTLGTIKSIYIMEQKNK